MKRGKKYTLTVLVVRHVVHIHTLRLLDEIVPSDTGSLFELEGWLLGELGVHEALEDVR